MPDYSILQRHAEQNVWCNPRQDKQIIFKTSRISPSYGTRHSFSAMHERHSVPVIGKKFHVFKIGYIADDEVNLKLSYQWVKVNTLCNTRNMLIDIYLTAGLMLPRSECWIKTTLNGALILAVKQDRLIEFNTIDSVKSDVLMNNTPSVKFYTNKYFSSEESLTNPRDVYVYGRSIDLASDILTFSEQYSVYQSAVGKVYGYINGWFIADFSPAQLVVGDYAEIVYDSSVVLVGSVPVSLTPTFTSAVTNSDRYFLSTPTYQNNILFYDDIDFYITGSGAYLNKGLYISRDVKDTIKMMTHAGFSISDEVVSSLLHSTTPPLNLNGPHHFNYIVRNSGLTRDLTSSRNRIDRFLLLAKTETELPEFAYENDLPLLEWKYSSIESASINTLYGIRYSDMTPELVKEAYGYHATARALAPSTQPVIISEIDGTKSVTISSLFTYGCTVFEYSVDGVLLEYHLHSGTDTYVPNNDDTVWVEIVTGTATAGVGVGNEDSTLTINPNFENRFYKGVPGALTDVTGFPDYTLTGNNVAWPAQVPGFYTLVLTDEYFYCVEHITNPDEAVISFPVGYYTGPGPGMTFKTSNVPTAEVDVWLNGYPMAELIDYHVVWPNVVVTNVNRRLPDNAPNIVLIRARGHGNVTKGYQTSADSGFIKWGLFSANDRYDVHWDQSLKVTVDGKSVIPENIVYSDNDNESVYIPYPGIFESEFSDLSVNRSVVGSTVITLGISQNHPLNGKPYSIKDSYAGLTAAVPGSTKNFREDILDFDKRLSTYLTEKLPDKMPTLPNVITEKYSIVSPFLEACMDGLINETIPESVWNKFDYDVSEVLANMSSQTYLLLADVTQDAIFNNIETAIVDICAHPYADKVPMLFNQYRFLEFVAHDILNDRVDVSRFFNITGV